MTKLLALCFTHLGRFAVPASAQEKETPRLVRPACCPPRSRACRSGADKGMVLDVSTFRWPELRDKPAKVILLVRFGGAR